MEKSFYTFKTLMTRVYLGIGLFGGSHRYVIDNNHVCGNNGQEYGGGISHFGVSEYGSITNNWLLWNRAVDEGGGIMIASETLNAASTAAYPAFAGDVNISGNIIQGCVSGDDGGGIRFLNPGASTYHVHDNIITHNVAMHEGGGVSINDAPVISLNDNVIMNNLATGTAVEAYGTLLAAGLATNAISPALQGEMTRLSIVASQKFYGNKFWDNRASNGEIVGNQLQGQNDTKHF